MTEIKVPHAEILALVKSGKPIAQIARDLGVCRQTVYNAIKAAGYVAADTRWVRKQ